MKAYGVGDEEVIKECFKTYMKESATKYLSFNLRRFGINQHTEEKEKKTPEGEDNDRLYKQRNINPPKQHYAGFVRLTKSQSQKESKQTQDEKQQISKNSLTIQIMSHNLIEELTSNQTLFSNSSTNRDENLNYFKIHLPSTAQIICTRTEANEDEETEGMNFTVLTVLPEYGQDQYDKDNETEKDITAEEVFILIEEVLGKQSVTMPPDNFSKSLKKAKISDKKRKNDHHQNQPIQEQQHTNDQKYLLINLSQAFGNYIPKQVYYRHRQPQQEEAEKNDLIHQLSSQVFSICTQSEIQKFYEKSPYSNLLLLRIPLTKIHHLDSYQSELLLRKILLHSTLQTRKQSGELKKLLIQIARYEQKLRKKMMAQILRTKQIINQSMIELLNRIKAQPIINRPDYALSKYTPEPIDPNNPSSKPSVFKKSHGNSRLSSSKQIISLGAKVRQLDPIPLELQPTVPLDTKTVVSTIWDKQQELIHNESLGTKMRLNPDNKKYKSVKQQLEEENMEDLESDVEELSQDELMDTQNPPVVYIPLEFDDQGSSFNQFAISNFTATKIGGFGYESLFIKYIIPPRGKYAIQIKMYQTTKACFWFGISEAARKYDLPHSTHKNYFIYRISTCHIVSNIEGVEIRTHMKGYRYLKNGEWVRMEVNMNTFQVKWILSYGKEVTGSIPIQLRKVQLMPFVCLFRSGEAVTFQDIRPQVL